MNTEDVLFDLDQSLQANGYPPLDAATLKETYKHLQHPEVQRQIQSGQLTTERMLVDIMEAFKGMKVTPKAQAQPTSSAPLLKPPAPPPQGSAPGQPSLMPPYVEGGFVNDRSGQATRKLRQQYRRP